MLAIGNAVAIFAPSHFPRIGREGGAGRVFVDGKEWLAELEGQGPVDPCGEVELTALIGGVRRRVRALAPLRGSPASP